MEVVREVVEDELHLNIPIAGLAKDDRHRTNELLYGFPPQTIGIDVKSATVRKYSHKYRMRCTVLPSLFIATNVLKHTVTQRVRRHKRYWTKDQRSTLSNSLRP